MFESVLLTNIHCSFLHRDWVLNKQGDQALILHLIAAWVEANFKSPHRM
jgi:hypothetical protein